MNWKFWQRRDDTIGPDPTEAHPLGKGFSSGDTAGGDSSASGLFKGMITVAAIYLLAALALGIWWSQEPDRFDIETAARELGQSGDTNVTGYLTTATTITVAKTLLEKPGGYLTNDLFAPGI